LHYVTKTQIKQEHKFYKNNTNEDNLIINMGWCKIDLKKKFTFTHLQGEERCIKASGGDIWGKETT
jgi:hypothetical protein